MKLNRTSFLIGASVLSLLCTTAAQAQFGGYGTPYRGAYGTGVRRGVPVVPYGGYGGPVVENPYGAYLNGVSNVIGAQGQYGKDYQQARMMNQQAEQEKIKTRYMLMQQRQYEQSIKPTYNKVREKKQRENLRTAMNDPPLTEIISGRSLNILLASQQKYMAQGVYGPTIPLSPYLLEKINVTASTGGGDVGVYRDGGKLTWPTALQAPLFDKDRKKADELAAQAVKEIQSQGSVSAATIQEMTENQKRLNDLLVGQVRDMPMGDYMTAKRYVDNLESGITALKSPGAANYFNNRWTAKGQSVAELVSYMSAEGLNFGPASRGSEPAYKSLHQSMVSYEYGVQSMAQASAKPPEKKTP